MNESIDSPRLRARRSATLSQLRTVLSERDVDGARRCADRLRAVLESAAVSGEAATAAAGTPRTVLVAYGGGKDSSYTLAFVRLMQLLLLEAGHPSFRLRSVTNRHAGMPRAVMENIDRAYRALALPDDPACELLLVDGDQVRPFDVSLPNHPDVVRRNRTDILMTGHRTAADARPTFCNACNLSMVNAFGLAAGFGGGVDVVVTGDSRTEQRDYRLWVQRLGRRHGLLPDTAKRSGFGGFLSTVDNIAQAYFSDIHGSHDEQAVAARRVATDVRADLCFFSIYEDTAYRSGDHWRLLTDLLGFVFDDLAFSFSESDCGNPALMAHLRGLKCERIFERGYADGLREYTDYALALMARKEFPQRLLTMMANRYREPGADVRMRKVVEEYARDAFGLEETHLVCMVYAPFLASGAGLADYLRREQPELLHHVSELHQLLAAAPQTATAPGSGAPGLSRQLAAISGLSLDQLRVLYRSPARPAAAAGAPDLIGAILSGDPHKSLITTRHRPDGPLVTELLSGR